ncbi:hypothetical protein EDD31_0375 [Bogoriella caseilytica]|uniref:Uncharacterized protein n=1 Tax=Bogoriella caseilytica TaxID=56055 RepID=A0A3N2B9T2_9MICO|nr:hypothetical protein EDD31_0375 [Bogoriella caseilytica]
MGTGLEIVLLGAGAFAGVVTAVISDIGPRAYLIGIPLALALASFAVLLGAGIRALRAGRRWGRGPLVTWQILQIATAYALLPDIPAAVAGVGVVLAVVTAAGVLWPSSRAYASGVRSDSAVPPE